VAALAARSAEMLDSTARRDVVGRREGRRSHGAYQPHPRGIRLLIDSDRMVRSAESRLSTEVPARDTTAFNAGIALALLFPLVRRMRRAFGVSPGSEGSHPASAGNATRNEGVGMKRKPSIKSLETVSSEEASAYLENSGGDELGAAHAIALDRARLDGSHVPPDDAEVHHALFLLCRACGKRAPSFDEMRVELRRRLAA
jgi:hypothetical protein